MRHSLVNPRALSFFVLVGSCSPEPGTSESSTNSDTTSSSLAGSTGDEVSGNTPGASTTAPTSTSGDEASSGSGGVTSSDPPPSFDPTPVRDIPGLTSIVFYESSDNPNCDAYEVGLEGDERLNSRLMDAMLWHGGTYDFRGGGENATHEEFYDVFYSDEEGNADIDGQFLTISAVFHPGNLTGSGFNICEIELRAGANVIEHGKKYIKKHQFFGGGTDDVVGSQISAVDGDFKTYTTGGNKPGAQTDRMYIVIGFQEDAPE